MSLFSPSADSKFNCFMYLIILKHHFFPTSIQMHTDKSKVTTKSNGNNARFIQQQKHTGNQEPISTSICKPA